MPAEFIRRRERIKKIEYYLEYPVLDTPGAFWAPPCDEKGNVLEAQLAEPALKEWQRVQECERKGEPTGYGEPYVQKRDASYWEPAVIRCACGRECTLWGMENDCDCGRIYNGFGQEYRPREEWADAMEAAGERWDDDY